MGAGCGRCLAALCWLAEEARETGHPPSEESSYTATEGEAGRGYAATESELGDLTGGERELHEQVKEAINTEPIKGGCARCYHYTSLERAFKIIDEGLRPSSFYNTETQRYNLCAGVFVTTLSPLDFGFPAAGWRERLLNNNYGVNVVGKSPNDWWVKHRGDVCLVLDLPFDILKNAAEQDPEYKTEGRNVFYVPKQIFDIFGKAALPPENVVFAFRTTLEEPTSKMAKTLQRRLAAAVQRGDLFQAEWLMRLAASPEEVRHKLLQKFWPEMEAWKIQRALVSGSARLALRRWSGNETGAVALLMKALEPHDSLQVLDLRGASIGPLGAAVLAEALARSHCSLRCLKLFDNRIGAEGTSRLCQTLQCNSSLRELRLGRNGIGYKGAAAVSEALRRNTALQELDLMWNELGKEGAAPLQEALQCNRVLQVLNLDGNKFGDTGITTLCRGLQLNSTLRVLGLWANGIGRRGATALEQALQSNTSLQTLNLGLNYLRPQEKSALRAKLRHIPNVKL